MFFIYFALLRVISWISALTEEGKTIHKSTRIDTKNNGR